MSKEKVQKNPNDNYIESKEQMNPRKQNHLSSY